MVFVSDGRRQCVMMKGESCGEWKILQKRGFHDLCSWRKILGEFLIFQWSEFIHSVFCLTTGPKPPPKRCLHIVRSRASSKWEYPLLSLRSSSSFLRLLLRLFATSISPFIFPSITCFRRQFLRKMWPIQLAFPLLFRVGYSSAYWL